MNPETKQCQNCHNPFTIEPDDFAFYEKMAVPPPTWCPECRVLRRLLWLNSRSLFKHPCQAPGHTEALVAKYHPNAKRVVYDKEYWWSDKWEPTAFGRDYDFSRPFFEQFNDLLKQVPVRDLNMVNSVNCDYCQSAVESKDCYMCVGGYRSERCFYSDSPISCKDCFDSYMVVGCDTVYEGFQCNRSFNISFCSYCDDCMDSVLLFDCRNCSNCFGCVSLRNKQYHIFNKPYTKQEYQAAVEGFAFGSFRSRTALNVRFDEFALQFPKKFAFVTKTENVTGDVIENAKNCLHCFEIKAGAENCKYLVTGGFDIKDSYDVVAGGAKSESLYEALGVGPNCQNVLFSSRIQESFDVRYSAECYTNAHLFGCVSLRNKKHCILNKQYTEEEYEALIPKIIEHMNAMPYVDQKGRAYRYGEFFPPELSPFAYNQSDAQEFFSFSKEEATQKGYCWEEATERSHKTTVPAAELPDDIGKAPDSVLNEAIECSHAGRCDQRCSVAFRIIPQELALYRKLGLPLPRLCPNCRMYERLKRKNPLKLWHRQCMCDKANHSHEGKCPVEFETSYAPDRKEIVYCEQCYNAEVV